MKALLNPLARQFARCCSVLALSLPVLFPSPSYGGEIDVVYKNLGGTLTLTATQGGNALGNPQCSATGCSLFIKDAAAEDFPAQFLVAGVELLNPGFLNPRTFSDLVHYSVENFLKSDPLSACRGDLKECSADISLEFFAYPFGFIPAVGNSPTFTQPFADGLEHELTVFFEDPSIDFPTPVVGLPPAAIHVFVTADGMNAVPEPTTALLLGPGLAGLALWRLRKKIRAVTLPHQLRCARRNSMNA